MVGQGQDRLLGHILLKGLEHLLTLLVLIPRFVFLKKIGEWCGNGGIDIDEPSIVIN